MGSGRNGSFDKVPDLNQWAVLVVLKNEIAEAEQKDIYIHTKAILGKFISGWYKFFNCELLAVKLKPLEGRGEWDGKKPFGDLPSKSDFDGPIAVLTRATIRLGKLSFFWKHVAPASASMLKAEGFKGSFGIGEIPWIKQATFSVWESKNAMISFAYRTAAHAEIVRKTREQKWYSEDMFVRFQILKLQGTVKGKNPFIGIA